MLAHFQGTLSKSKNRPRFRCQICHKEFAYNSTFNVHMRTHTDERPFEVRRTAAVCMRLHNEEDSVSLVDWNIFCPFLNEAFKPFNTHISN